MNVQVCIRYIHTPLHTCCAHVRAADVHGVVRVYVRSVGHVCVCTHTNMQMVNGINGKRQTRFLTQTEQEKGTR